jgi:TPR repeat protein
MCNCPDKRFDYIKKKKYVLAKTQAELTQDYEVLGVLYELNSEYDNAIAMYNLAIENKNYDGYYRLGNLYIEHEQYEDAYNILKKSILHNNIKSLVLLGDLYYMNEQIDTAIWFYEKATQKCSCASIKLANLLKEKHLLIAVEKGDAEAMYQLSVHRDGDIKLLEKASQQNHLKSILHLALLYEKSDLQKAIEYYEKAVGLGATHVIPQLGKLYTKDKREWKADVLYESFSHYDKYSAEKIRGCYCLIL